MSVLLDTDLISIVLDRSQPAFGRLDQRLRTVPDAQIYCTIVSFQEHIRGWLAFVNGAKKASQLLTGYRRLEETRDYYCRTNVLPFNQDAQDHFEQLRAQRVRIGTMDLRIASIALAGNLTLASRNLRDFRQVPGLVVEDWTQ